jgi:hypothetical protein
MQQYVASYRDVEGDGNCGYRAVAVSPGVKGGDKCYQEVRRFLDNTLNNNIEYYKRTFEIIHADSPEVISQRLRWFQGACMAEGLRRYWMELPVMGKE